MFSLVFVDDVRGQSPLFIQATHSETLAIGNLVYGDTEPPITAKEAEELTGPELAPGFITHRRRQLPYFLICTAYWIATKEHGVCYRALYPIVDAHGRYWFRPLRTPNSKGFLDPDHDGGPRFIRSLPTPSSKP